MESPLNHPHTTALRREVRVRGVVQGVGFRPFVYALAARLNLSGEVSNDVDGVLAQVQGAPSEVETFCRAVAEQAPPLAMVESVTWHDLPPRAESGFVIGASAATGSGRRTLVPADVAPCADCLAELADPADRRHRHPFITCTNCGPRFTIVAGLPYDRPMTTMADFPLCAACAREYADPADRRFHAQPIGCHDCGPVLELVEPGAEPRHREDALGRARDLLARGAIVAVKGIGGYHLACDATNEAAVSRLRARKRRGDKPFAILVPDLATARTLVHLDDAAAAALTSPRRPIVLLPALGSGAGTPGTGPGVGRGIAAEVAPRVGRLGVMLPPSPVHHLLVESSTGAARILVLTSGNLAGEPIVTDDDEAVERLGGIADAWLRHNRAIHVPCDDSVLTLAGGTELPIRRSRGYAPMPVALPFEVEPTLAVGGDLKNTFCLARGRQAWLSGHLGDMDDLATQQAFEHAVGHLQELVEVTPGRLVADAHPAYRSAAWARRRAAADGLEPPLAVQHHHAHLAAVMAEHQLGPDATVLGFAFDGTGFGTDGAIWGGEVLLARYDGFTRLAHLDYVPLPGGDASVHRPYRMGLAHLHHAGIDWEAGGSVVSLPPAAACPDDERRVLAHQLRTGLACVPTSSMGRLFDAVASLIGACHHAGYEAQAAMELQALAEQAVTEGGRVGAAAPSYPLPLLDGGAAGARWRWDVAALIRAIADDVRAGRPREQLALGFHRAIAAAVADLADRVRAAPPEEAPSGGLDAAALPVALSGGVFCNALLLTLTRQALLERGFAVFTHQLVPPNDGGLALGQLAVGARRGSPSRGEP
ncbi:MAG: carbamoyltransferase HypF [Kineosporiaceae bacterium]|nr:carbamoyltransferase HypF [Kineosporiaceae bacterium]